MFIIHKVVYNIEVLNKFLTENNNCFEKLLKRLVFLNNYKISLDKELIERKRKLNDILTWREKECTIQKQRKYPILKPIYSLVSSMGYSCSWDPWLCAYIPNNLDDDLDLCIPSELNVDYDRGHENLTINQLLE